MERIDEQSMARRVLMMQVNRALVGNRPRLGWIKGRVMTMEAVRKFVKDRNVRDL